MMNYPDDYLAPMFVKELRQGLRSKVFVSAFLLTQLVMIVSVIFGLILVHDTGNLQGASYFFWSVIGFPLLFLLPVRGFVLLSEEVKENTLELVFLTRLTAWRIILGKWLCLLFQSFLLCTAILPYLILRYYLGGINILDDVQQLFILFGVSAIFSSITLGVSCYNQGSKVPKWILNGIFRTAIFIVGFYLLILSFSSYSLQKLLRSLMISSVILIVYGIFISCIFLVFGASRIAPPAENYTARKRIFGFILLLFYWLFTFLGTNEELVTKLTLILFSVLWLDAILEDTKSFPSIFQPFVKRGFWGRKLGLLFYPGWSTGFLYTLVTLTLLGIQIRFLSKTNPGEIWEFGLPFIGAILLPLAIIKLFQPDKQALSKFYWIFQLSILLLLLIVEGFINISSHSVRSAIREFLIYLPHYQLFNPSAYAYSNSFLFCLFHLSTMLSVIVLTWRMKRSFSAIHVLENQVEKEMDKQEGAIDKVSKS